MDQNASTPNQAVVEPAQPAVMPTAAAVGQPEAVSTYAGFWRRFAALLIDGIVVGIVTSPIYSLLHVSTNSRGYINWVVTIAYFVALQSSAWQATVGKKAMGAKVTDLNGAKVGVDKLILRELMKVVSAFILLIGFLMMLWDSKKQTLHDKVAGTLVVRG